MHITNRKDLVPGIEYRGFAKMPDIDGNEQNIDCGTITVDESGNVHEQSEFVVHPWNADYWVKVSQS